jgi:hypothetical protein
MFRDGDDRCRPQVGQQPVPGDDRAGDHREPDQQLA